MRRVNGKRNGANEWPCPEGAEGQIVSRQGELMELMRVAMHDTPANVELEMPFFNPHIKPSPTILQTKHLVKLKPNLKIFHL